MDVKRTAGVVSTVLICVSLAAAGHILSVEKSGVVTDEEGSTIARIMYNGHAVNYDCEDGYEAYIDLACREAAKLIAEKESVEEDEAFRMIAEDGLHIRTALRPDVMNGLLQAAFEMTVPERAAAVSDTKGHMLACYSQSLAEPSRNYVTYPAYAGSTVKPLSVYGPAIEDGTVFWSKLYEDSDYYQITDEAGRKTDWPVNTEPYTNTMWTVQEALKKSNNAITVKILKEYGVEKSCKFIQDKFGLKTDEEQLSILEKGEDSVLANIALGYLEEGVTMQDMLSGYQVFANGGYYIPVHTVIAVETRAGEEYYREKAEYGQVFSSETAYIMNRMLKSVVEEDGTGAEAEIEGLDICGKTGTSGGNKDNWFIGMTPEYVCAVWYEQPGIPEGNRADVVFREIMKNLEHSKELSYPESQNVVNEMYCQRTGLIANEFCMEQHTGYYKKQYVPKKCNCR